MTHRNGFLLFISSCLSGCGQMYQGYMKRGLSLLLAFCLILFASTYFFLGALALFLPVIWLYAFFDSYALRSQLAAGTAPEDAFLFGLSDMDSKRLGELLRKRHSLIDWALVVVGVYMLYDILLSQLGGLFFGWFGEWLYGLLRYGLPRLVITVLVILLGLWFIRGPKDKTPTDDEIPPFAPPASSAAGACAADPAEARAEDVASDRSAAGNAPEGEEAHRDEQTPESRPARDRRVGTFTFGAVLVICGALMLVSMFFPSLDLTLALQLSPLILVCLGVEVLLASRSGGKIRYDWVGMVLCFVLVTAALVFFGIAWCLVYHPEAVIHY